MINYTVITLLTLKYTEKKVQSYSMIPKSIKTEKTAGINAIENKV